MQIGEFKNNHNTFYFYDRAVNIGGTIGQYVIYYQRFYNLNACIHSEQHFLLGNYMYKRALSIKEMHCLTTFFTNIYILGFHICVVFLTVRPITSYI